MSPALLAASVLAGAAPLVLAALGEAITEKSGVINLSLDGTLLLSAMAGFVTALSTGSLAAGFLVSIISGALVAAFLSLLGTWLGQSQVAAGFALTFFCRDLAYFLGSGYARQQGPQLGSTPVPVLSELPFVGTVLFNHSGVVYLSFLAIPLVWFFLYHTRFGLVLQAAGEHPEACWARGMHPKWIQTGCTLLGGGMVGLAGGAFSLAVKPGWGQPQGCEGIGWIALALVIFGGWHPLRIAMSAYFFGLLQIVGILLQDTFPALPAQAFQVAPFPLMIFALVLLHFCRTRRVLRQSPLLQLLSGTPPSALGRGWRQN